MSTFTPQVKSRFTWMVRSFRVILGERTERNSGAQKTSLHFGKCPSAHSPADGQRESFRKKEARAALPAPRDAGAEPRRWALGRCAGVTHLWLRETWPLGGHRDVPVTTKRVPIWLPIGLAGSFRKYLRPRSPQITESESLGVDPAIGDL